MTDRGYINTEAFRDNGRDQLREMIFQQFNHPSVAVWGIFFDQTPRGDDPTAYVISLKDNSRASTTRETPCSASSFAPSGVCTDICVEA